VAQENKKMYAALAPIKNPMKPAKNVNNGPKKQLLATSVKLIYLQHVVKYCDKPSRSLVN